MTTTTHRHFWMKKFKYKYTLTRDIKAPVALVWKCWTDPKHLKHWFIPLNFELLECSADASVGGEWMIRIRSPEGSVYSTHGVYKEIVKEKRLLITQLWEGSDHQTEITVTLSAKDNKTYIVFEHRYLDSEASSDSHAEGWAEVFDNLKRYLES